VMYLSALNRLYDLTGCSRTYHFLTNDSLQSTDQQESRARAMAGNCAYDAFVKFDTSEGATSVQS